LTYVASIEFADNNIILVFKVTTNQLAGKPGNIWELNGCQGNIRKLTTIE